MSTRRDELFTTVRTEGGLLPPSLLSRVAAADGTLAGLRPEDYHLAPGERLTEAINRSWSRLVGAWAGFTDALAAIPAENPAQGLTYDRWLLLLFSELGYGRLQRASAVEIDSNTYPVSHAWGSAPIHLVGAHVELHVKTPGVAGAAKVSPHGLVQDLLNRSDDRLWGFVSNGLRLRILRDNVALTRQAYVEFDLQAMFDSAVYSDFVVLWLLAHQSRVEAPTPEECWFEQWSVEARTEGARALDNLRDSVEAAIGSLGSGFLAHPDNTVLRAALRDGTVRPVDYYRQLLRVVYRLLFLLVAERRDLLLLPSLDADTAPAAEVDKRISARARYNAYYSIARVRELSERRRGTQHVDLWQQVQLVVRLLGATGSDALALPAIGSYLFSAKATPELDASCLPNTALLAAVRALSGRDDDKAGYRWLFDYANLGVEELGSVYQSLLELHPDVDLGSNTFTLTTGGKERRATGSHYTPPAILKRVLDFAVEPAIVRALGAPDPAQALLDLRILDPAVGSGHFLIAIAHRIARALTTVRTGEAEPPPEDVRGALRDVVARCLYGVDLNPMAVELCRFALWLETLDPGRPLSFLDHHIRVGNSILGVPVGKTVERNRAAVVRRREEIAERIADIDGQLREFPALAPERAALEKEKSRQRKELADCVYDSWADAIPNEAFKAAPDDDTAVARRWARANRLTRKKGQMQLHGDVLVELPQELVAVFDSLGQGAENSVAEVSIRAEMFEGAQRGAEYAHLVELANAWMAAFFWPLRPGAPEPPYQASFLTLQSAAGSLPASTAEMVTDLALDRWFCHFELAFPEVFVAGRRGFDVVVGNPPYLGALRISAELGPKVSQFLKANAPEATANVDLASYFFRRGFDLLRDSGDLCYITTNSVTEGDSRAGGLDVIINTWGGELVNAVRPQAWEGTANVAVVTLHLHRGPWDGIRTLDGVPVSHIANDVTAAAGAVSEPQQLTANGGTCFQGSNLLGKGFQLTAEAAHRFIEDDERNAIVVKPLLGGDDLTTQPGLEPPGWVIDFGARTLDEAAEFPGPLAIVRQLVKPKRDSDKRKARRERWWQFAEKAPNLYAAIANLDRVIAMPQVSKTMLPAIVRTGMVYTHKLIVFASDDHHLFGELTSNLHWLWAAKRCSTMRVDPTYTPTDCWMTFPRPPRTDLVSEAARALEIHRSRVMRARGEGLTKIYNRVVKPAETAKDIAELRDLHVALDLAVSTAYGWDDLDWGHGVHETPRFGVRWTAQPETQREIEQRLLKLNLQRAAEESS